MYDSNYFRKIIGENVNPNDYFETNNNINNTSSQIIDENTYMKNQNGFMQNQVPTQKKTQTPQPQINTQNQVNTQTKTNVQSQINTQSQVNTQSHANMQPRTNAESQANVQSRINPSAQVDTQSRTNIHQANHTIYDHYPEIYKIIMPMVEEAVKRHSGQNITPKLIEDITTEIFNALEVDNNINKNKVLYDLIKILVLNYFVNNFIMTSTIPNPYPEDL